MLDEKKVAMKYLKSWFLLDAITSIPVSQITQAIFIGRTSHGLAALTLPRMFRIFRVARLFKILRMLKLMTVMSNWSESSNEKLFSLFIKITKFLALIFLLAHLSACIWGFIGLQQTDAAGNFHHLSWPFRAGVFHKKDATLAHLYAMSIYWALCTLTTGPCCAQESETQFFTAHTLECGARGSSLSPPSLLLLCLSLSRLW